MPPALALDVSDAGVLGVAEGGRLVGPSPGYALVEGDTILVGEEAFGRAHLRPRLVMSRFWEKIDAEPLGRPFPDGLTAADLVHAHLADIWGRAGRGVGEVVLAVPKGAPETTIKRSDIVLVTPDSKAVPLATQAQFQEAAYLRALNNRLRTTRDPINYAPIAGAGSRPLNFIGDPSMAGMGALGKNEISISEIISATGRIYSHLPGGIQHGFHNLDVDFGDSRIKVPFDIFTKESEKEFEKKLKELKKKKD